MIRNQLGAPVFFPHAAHELPAHERMELGVLVDRAVDANEQALRFEIREPRLEFQEWLDAGQPAVHQIRGARGLQAKLTGASH